MPSAPPALHPYKWMEGNNKFQEWTKNLVDSSCTEWNLKPIHVVLMHSPLKQKAVSPTTNPAIHWHLLACLLGLLRKATFARSTFEIDVSFSCLSHRLSSNKLNNFSNREGLGVPEYKKSPQAGTLRNESKHFWGAVGARFLVLSSVYFWSSNY